MVKELEVPIDLTVDKIQQSGLGDRDVESVLRITQIFQTILSGLILNVAGLALAEGLTHVGGNEKLYVKLLHQFSEQQAAAPAEITQAIARGDRLVPRNVRAEPPRDGAVDVPLDGSTSTRPPGDVMTNRPPTSVAGPNRCSACRGPG